MLELHLRQLAKMRQCTCSDGSDLTHRKPDPSSADIATAIVQRSDVIILHFTLRVFNDSFETLLQAQFDPTVSLCYLQNLTPLIELVLF